MDHNNPISPPKLALKLIEWFCPDRLQEAIIGDLCEQYEINLDRHSKTWSKILFTYNVIRFFRYGILSRKAKRQHSNSTAMFKNYFKTSIRNLVKQKFYLLLNVLGLSIGISAFLICYLHLGYELSYDKQSEHSDNIYRLVTGDVNSGNGWVKVSAPMAPKLMEVIPEIERFARFESVTYNPYITVAYEDVIFSENKFYMADPAFLDMFSLPLVRGQRNTVLSDLNSVIISESMAEKYFGYQDPMGKKIRIDDKMDFIVTGVFSDIPINTHYDFDFLISFENLERVLPNTSLTANWGQFNYFTYLQLSEQSEAEQVVKKIQSTELNIGSNRTFDLANINIQALADVHFVENQGNIKPAYDFNYIYIYSAIAIGILFISFINFVNLTIANSSKRLKEVGIRQVVGALKAQLIIQFIIESLIVALFSVLVALAFCQFVFIPSINDLLNSQISFDFADPLLSVVITGLLLIISLSAGGYVAYFIITSKPVNILKGSAQSGKKGGLFKNILLGLQLTISTTLILSSLFIYQQLNFMNGKDLGFEKEGVLNVFLNNETMQQKGDVIAARLEQISGVTAVSGSDFVPGSPNWNNQVWWEGQEEAVTMPLITVHPKFIQTMGLELVEGNLDQIEESKKTQIVLNQKALEYIGWNSGLGKAFSPFGKSSGLRVDGVVKDYNFKSLHFEIEPCVLVLRSEKNYNQLSIKVQSSNLRATVDEMEAGFKEIIPDMPFEFTFVDDSLAQLYASEQRTSKIVATLTIVAILLASLGLYALLSFTLKEKTRELAIRKVLGVKSKQILWLLTRNYITVFAVASVIAVPLTYSMMNNWLDNFGYRIDLSPTTFIITISGILILISSIALIKTIHSGKINPTDALRHD